MPDRVLRQGILSSDAVNMLSWPAEVFYRRLMSILDDYGRYEADPSLLRAYLYPKKLLSVSEPDVVKWLGECSNTGLVRLYRIEKKDYLQVENFGQRLRAMKSKYPPPPPASADIGGHLLTNDSGRQQSAAEEKRNESESETEKKRKDSPTGDGEAGASPPDPWGIFKDLEKMEGTEKKKKALCDFLNAHHPDFYEPYQLLWNLFAAGRKIPLASKMSDARKKKLSTRLKEKTFDLVAILTRAGKANDFLLAGKWFTFDWILENESNYLKVLEGNYDKVAGKAVAQEPPKETINYLYERYLDGDLKSKFILESHFDELATLGWTQLEERHLVSAVPYRLEHLKGTNQAPELRLLDAYESGKWPTDPDCQADRPVLTRIGKKLAVLEVFQNAKNQNLKSLKNVDRTAT